MAIEVTQQGSGIEIGGRDRELRATAGLGLQVPKDLGTQSRQKAGWGFLQDVRLTW